MVELLKESSLSHIRFSNWLWDLVLTLLQTGNDLMKGYGGAKTYTNYLIIMRIIRFAGVCEVYVFSSSLIYSVTLIKCCNQLR